MTSSLSKPFLHDLNLINRTCIIKNNYYAFIVISTVIIFLFALSTLANHSFALQVLSGNHVSIDQSIKDNDDILVSAGTVDINYPIHGAIIFANIVNINSLIQGDLVVVGGQITINNNVSGKIVAAGNNIILNGKTKNAIMAANNIMIHSPSLITKDAYVASKSINNEGNIMGRLVAFTNNFQNNGTVGKVDLRSQPEIISLSQLNAWFNIFNIVVTIGFGILGIVLVKFLPSQFNRVRISVNQAVIKNTIVGFLLIILFVIVIILLAITVVGLPIAAFGLLILLTGLMLSSLFVAFALGKKIIQSLLRRPDSSTENEVVASDSNNTKNNIFSFIIGFVILNLIYVIPVPYFAQIAQIIVVSMGFGSIYYTIRNKKK